MTIWNVMRVYESDGECQQLLPYNMAVFGTLLRMEHGLRAVFKFIENSRLTEKGARKLANKKNNKITLE